MVDTSLLQNLEYFVMSYTTLYYANRRRICVGDMFFAMKTEKKIPFLEYDTRKRDYRIFNSPLCKRFFGPML